MKKARLQKPKTFRVVDCETDGFHNCEDPTCVKCGGRGRVPQPFIWGTYEGGSGDYEEFATAEQFVERAAEIGGTWYAHNGGKFDYHYLREHVNSDQPVLIINGRLSRFNIGRAEFRDSLNIFPNTRLKDFDDSSGKKLEIDYELMQPGRRTDPNVAAEISRYLRVDCSRLWNVIRRYWDDYGRAITQATASMKYWESMYETKAPRQSKTEFDRYRKFYYGGRVQCFESGVLHTRFSVADINSAYPYAMLSAHPLSPTAIREKHLPSDSEELATSLIELDCTAKGCFPWKDPDTHEMYFPEDDLGVRKIRRYFITGHEFLAALELDAVSNIHIRNVHVFPQRVNFRTYIEHFYQLREEARLKGDVAGRIFGKYFMNSLYGKFGANCENYAEHLIASDTSRPHWEAKGYVFDQPWGDRFLMRRDPREDQLEDLSQSRWRYYNVATAASITGYVRAHLFRALSKSSGAIYCDTDSIAARDVGQLTFGDQLGAWKDEGTFDKYAIAGKKLYAFHKAGAALAYDPDEEVEKKRTWKIACKGVNFGSDEHAPEKIAHLASGGEVEHRPQVPTYSLMRDEPRFINRTLVGTYKDMSRAPDDETVLQKPIDPLVFQF